MNESLPLTKLVRKNSIQKLLLQLKSLFNIRNKKGLLGGTIVGFIVLAAITCDWWAPHDPSLQNLRARLTPPFWISGDYEFLLGTDPLGRDVLSRMIYGTRVSLLIGVVSVVLAGILGTSLGLIAGFYGGMWDHLIMRITDVQMSIPFVISAVAIVAIVEPSITIVILVLILNSWKMYSRVARAEVLSLREQEFILAARSIGANNLRIIIFHLIPNIFGSISVVATLTIAQMILAESALSYLGLGVPADTPSWGNMIASGRDYLTNGWWISTFPGIAIIVSVFGVNLIGESLSERYNPELTL